jgi:hypothetical protein
MVSHPTHWLISTQVLDLTGNGFTGAFPKNVAKLTGLRTLRLGRNKLTGPLPEAWRSLRRLDTLDVHSNKLTGEALPPWLVEGCTLLRDYRAGDNHLTSLTVPGPCGLRRLELFGNDLEGQLSVWKLNFGRPTPSTRCCLRSCVCSMAWRFTKVHAIEPNSLVDFHTGHSRTPFICARNCATSTSRRTD